jgi:hypothetical protein
MKVFMPKCHGNESNLFECSGTVNPEQGLTVCDNENVISLHCEGFDNQLIKDYDNWAGIVFQKYAPFQVVQQFTSAFYNISKSVLQYVDIKYAGLSANQNPLRPNYTHFPGSAITVFQYSPTFMNITVEYSLGNGLNFSNIEAPALITDSVFRFNRGHGIAANSRFGNVSVFSTQSYENMGDGLKYTFNNTAWSYEEQKEHGFLGRYIPFCDSQNPLSYPAYYRFKNPNYVKECSKVRI